MSLGACPSAFVTWVSFLCVLCFFAAKGLLHFLPQKGAKCTKISGTPWFVSSCVRACLSRPRSRLLCRFAANHPENCYSQAIDFLVPLEQFLILIHPG